MATITLPHGAVHYRDHGPDDATAPPVVFVHGILVGATLWSGVADALAARGVRSFAPDLPLGSHRVPVGPDADQSPRGVARQVIAFIEALDLHDVTLVGNDTGGAICQYVLDTDASRIGRVVLTNCDAFEQFPPPSLRRFIELVTRPAALAGAAQAMRATRFRHGRFGFGPFANSFDADMTAAWVEPARTDERVRDDLVRFARAIDPDDLVAVGGRLKAFAGRCVWCGERPTRTSRSTSPGASKRRSPTRRSSRSTAPARSSPSTRPNASRTRSSSLNREERRRAAS